MFRGWVRSTGEGTVPSAIALTKPDGDEWRLALRDMHCGHSKDLRARGETEQRIYMVSAWREASHLYSARERAALAWAEAVTRLVDQQVPDEVV